MKMYLSDNVTRLLWIYSLYSHEVGGALFGIRTNNDIYINALSLKHGSRMSITFCSDDNKIFFAPQGNFLIGTWHLHPNICLEIPSGQDIHQWNDWSCDLIHIILSRKGLTVFTSNAEVILNRKRVSCEKSIF